MTLSERGKSFEMSEATQSAERPKIWIEGRQRPRFDLKAYAATAYGMAKRDLPPEMLDAEGHLRGFGQRVVNGDLRPKLAWAGRLQRAVPSHQRVGGWLLGLADLIADSRALLVPVESADAELAYPNLIRGQQALSPLRPRPVAGLRVVKSQKPAVEPTLHAIRSAIGTTPHDASLDARGRLPPLTAADPQPARGNGKGLVANLQQSLWRAACRALLGILMGFAIPGGAVKALLYHLDGGDLADWS